MTPSGEQKGAARRKLSCVLCITGNSKEFKTFGLTSLENLYIMRKRAKTCGFRVQKKLNYSNHRQYHRR